MSPLTDMSIHTRPPGGPFSSMVYSAVWYGRESRRFKVPLLKGHANEFMITDPQLGTRHPGNLLQVIILAHLVLAIIQRGGRGILISPHRAEVTEPRFVFLCLAHVCPAPSNVFFSLCLSTRTPLAFIHYISFSSMRVKEGDQVWKERCPGPSETDL